MKKSILLQNVSFETLKKLIKEVVKSQLDYFKKELQTYNPDHLLTRDQTCEFLQINSSTLWHWTNKCKVTAYGIGNYRYYKYSELLRFFKPLIK